MDKERLLKDLNVEDTIEKCLNVQGAVVRVTVRGGKNQYDIPQSIYGVDIEKLSDEEKEFRTEHLSKGRVSFIPKRMQSEIKSIEVNARNIIKAAAIGYNNSYVPIKSLVDVSDKLDKLKDKFDILKCEMVNDYDNLKDRFEEIAIKSVNPEMNEHSKNDLMKLFNKIPSKDRFEESLSLDISYSTFAIPENLSLLPDDIKNRVMKTYNQSTDDIIRSGVITMLNGVFTSLCSILASARYKKPHYKQIDALKNNIESIAHKNIFGNATLDKIKEKLEEIVTLDEDDMLEASEILLGDIYHYATELKINEELDMELCTYSKKELKDLYEMYHP